MSSTPIRRLFDDAYFERFYLDPRTRIGDENGARKLGRFIGAYLDWLDIPVRRIVDLGCGLGRLREPLLDAFEKASYTGVDRSEYLCREYGWVQESAATFRSNTRFDLVICNDVLQYLDDGEAKESLENMAALCRGALFFDALTLDDWQSVCDRSLTDDHCHIREGRWYRKRLAPAFIAIGGGMFISRRANISTYELMRA
ncbi:class I SAM-dependent methyltransferase [Thioalkalivibrio sp. HK1]|uniref:class I SAM-dependent methyltransferase n=1 Tax=Thioalkalivibrio sp. HK1 TaxID=1469245 RepID=UPI00046F6338|nr:class I SAM-dependent methyltransferase [Thioalkalivibrio sp. HK1]